MNEYKRLRYTLTNMSFKNSLLTSDVPSSNFQERIFIIGFDICNISSIRTVLDLISTLHPGRLTVFEMSDDKAIAFNCSLLICSLAIDLLGAVRVSLFLNVNVFPKISNSMDYAYELIPVTRDKLLATC